MQKRNGFTLIELIVVITILSVLSAVALARFVDLQSNARTSVIEGVNGTVKSTNAILRQALWLDTYPTKVCPNFAPVGRVVEIYLEGTPAGGNCTNTTRFDPNVVWMIWGFMDDIAVDETIRLSGDFDEGNISWTDSFWGYDLNDDGNVQNDNCYFHYQQSLSDGDAPSTEAVISGC
jgi:prepilin-type N-terminal cleavage/methylation domain-containing protein